MNRSRVDLGVAGLCLACLGLAAALTANGASERRSLAAPDEWSVSGPYIHKNLAAYLIRGPDGQPGRRFLPLHLALAQGEARVHETGNVNQLMVENLSKECALFIQAGDIVRGGKQDRVLSIDLIAMPGSGRIPIDAFCVEAGRWARRGNEEEMSFYCSDNSVPSKGLKLAVMKSRSQGAV